jgi:hypothetical protein
VTNGPKWNFWKTQLFWQSLLLAVRESARELTVTIYRLLDFVNQRGQVERGQLHALPHEADDSIGVRAAEKVVMSTDRRIQPPFSGGMTGASANQDDFIDL